MKQTSTTSGGIRLAYFIDDSTDPWKPAPTLLMLHSAMSSAKQFYSMLPGLAKQMERRIPKAERIVDANGRHNVFDYLPERCVADTLAFLRKHFPEECS